MSLHGENYERRLVWRHRMGLGFEWMCRLATFTALTMLCVLLGSIVMKAMSSGRGSGIAEVTMTALDKQETKAFRVSTVLGGYFATKSDPTQEINEFTSKELNDGLVVFQHDGLRSAPSFDLVAIPQSGSEENATSYLGIGPGHLPANTTLPDVHLPAPPKPWGWLTWSFLTNGNSDDPLEAGIMVGLVGSLWLIGLTTTMAVPLGVGAAIYMEEYAKPTKFTRLIQLNIANLAGVPSIVYGILGYTVFARMFGFFDAEKTVLSLDLFGWMHAEIPLPFGPVVFSGACTLTLLSLPVVIISSQEALRSVPATIRHAAYALGATKWQTVWHQVIPAALPGILTGVILSLSRAIGEAAPLAVIGAAAQLSYAPGRITGIGDLVQHPEKIAKAPFDRFTALPMQVFSWINGAEKNFEHVAAAGILVLLATLLVMNGTAIFIRQRFQQKIRW